MTSTFPMLINPAIFIALKQLLMASPLLLIVVGSGICLSRARNGAGVILMAGSFLSLVSAVCSVGMTYLISDGAMSPKEVASNYVWIQALHFLAGLVFGTGFILMALGTPRSAGDGRSGGN